MMMDPFFEMKRPSEMQPSTEDLFPGISNRLTGHDDGCSWVQLVPFLNVLQYLFNLTKDATVTSSPNVKVCYKQKKFKTPQPTWNHRVFNLYSFGVGIGRSSYP
jgi:hypothetical protein